jgi:hypothetical protein
VGDPLTAGIDQMPGSQFPDPFVIDADKVSRQFGKAPAHQNVRYILLFNAPETLHRPLRGRDDQGIYAAGE